MSVSSHIRTHVVGYVAVFLALTGTAAALPGTNTVDSGDIVPSGVTAPDLGPEAVRGLSLADGGVASADLLDRGVRRLDLKADLVNGAKVEDGSLGVDDFAASAFLRRLDGGCGGQAWRYFRMTNSSFNCASPVAGPSGPTATILPGWRVTNGCHASGHAILGIESTEDFGTVNWFYSDGTALHADGIALDEGDEVSFGGGPSGGPNWGQFILSNPGDASGVPANAITLTFHGTKCQDGLTAAIGVL
jgi:hypothetical protein